MPITLSGKRDLSWDRKVASLEDMGDRFRDKPTASNHCPQENETLLDDFLWAIYKSRQQYALSPPQYRHAQLSTYASYDKTLGKIVERIIQRHGQGRGIFLRPHPLLDELGIVLEDEAVLTETCQGHRLPKEVLHLSLEKILELAVYTIAELPREADKVGYSTGDLQRLAGRFDTLAKKSQLVLNRAETRDRILVYLKNDGEATPASFFRVAGDLEMFANRLRRVISTTRVSRLRFDSPNPQVNLALYIVGWIGHVAGGPHYSALATLLSASFSAAGKKPPKWLDRLAVEMAAKRRRRKAFIKSITS